MDHFLTSVMTSHGYLALIIFAFIEACCIPISSEITFALAGWYASASAPVPNHFSLVLVIIIGTLAEMGGSLTSYAVGRRGGRTLLDRYGKWVLVSHSDLDRAERFFAGRGSWAVAVARVLPLVRCFASFGAGVVEIPVLPFTIFSLIGTALWATGLSLLGYNLGNTVNKFFHSFSLIGILLVVVLVAGLVAHRVHAVRKGSAHSQASVGAPASGGLPASPDDDAATPAAATAAPGKPKVTSTRTGGGAHRSGRGPSAS
jgi:membrane protein DedA with SNARE-associated domain